MHCDSVQRKLSTWENESHSYREQVAVLAHLEMCPTCQAYKAKVVHLEAMTKSHFVETMAVDLRPKFRIDCAGRSPQPLFGARKWALAGGLAFLAFGGFLASKHNNSFSASAELLRMAKAVQALNAVHQSSWQRGDDGNSGPLRLVDQIWFYKGRWRKTSLSQLGGDRVELTEADGVAHYKKDAEGHVFRLHELGEQPSSFSIADVLTRAGIPGSESKAESLGQVELDGKTLDKISIPTYAEQRTFVWLIPGKNLPVRIERQNVYKGEWVTSWVFEFEYADKWPDSKFDPSTLATGEPKPTK